MVLIQLLLPTRIPGGTDQDAAQALALTRDQLAAEFDGVTAHLRSPARGVWTAPDGRTEHDDVVMVEVVTSGFNRGWWRSYASVLAARFRQESMHIRALSIQTPDDDAPG
jgi:hypothetical protein